MLDPERTENPLFSSWFVSCIMVLNSLLCHLAHNKALLKQSKISHKNRLNHKAYANDFFSFSFFFWDKVSL